MIEKKEKGKSEKVKSELLEAYKKHLDEIFDQDTFNLTFDEREKLISEKMKDETCKVIEKHIKEDPKGISGNKHNPEESCLCECNTEALLCRDEQSNIKIFKREIKTKSGPVIVGEHGYYCTKCRKLFFSTKKNT